MDKKETLTRAVQIGLQKMLEESNIPLSVHKAVISKFLTELENYKKELKTYQNEIELSSKERSKHEKQVERIDRLIAEYESELQRYKMLAKGDKGESGRTPVKGVDYRDGEDGRTPTEQELMPLIMKAIEIYEANEPEDEEELDIEQIKTEIFKNLTIDKIKGLREYVSSQKGSKDGFYLNGRKYSFAELMHGGGDGTGGGSITYSYDLSSQCGGGNTVFTVPTNDAFLTLIGTDSPQVYRPGVDFTGSGTTTLTITGAVNPPSQGATLILTYKVR